MKCSTAEAWFEHLQNIVLSVDDSSAITITDRTAMLMEPIEEIEEQVLDDPQTPSSVDESLDREQSDVIKVKNVCRKLELTIFFDSALKTVIFKSEFLGKVR